MRWRGRPITLTLIGLSALGFLLFSVDGDLQWVRFFTFTGFQISGNSILFEERPWELWRWLTPVFLHFGWLHLVFNSLWTWDLGGKIEETGGGALMAALVLLSAVGSNYAQFLASGPSLFGGLSGVVYALLGFSLVVQYVLPSFGVRNPPAVYVMMLIWLLLCMSGVIEVLGFGAIANGAHLGGLLLGIAAGTLYALPRRFISRGT